MKKRIGSGTGAKKSTKKKKSQGVQSTSQGKRAMKKTTAKKTVPTKTRSKGRKPSPKKESQSTTSPKKRTPKPSGYWKSFWHTLKETKQTLKGAYLAATVLDLLFLLVGVKMIRWFNNRVAVLTLHLSSVNIDASITSSNTAELELAANALQSFVGGLAKSAALLALILFIAWYLTRWVLWNYYNERHGKQLLDKRLLSYMGRGLCVSILALPFLAYPLAALNNIQKATFGAVTTSVIIWTLIFFLMIILTGHFALTHSLVFFSETLPFWKHLKAVIKKGWKSIPTFAPLYMSALLVFLVFYTLLTLLARVLPYALLHQILLIAGTLLLLGIVRVYGRIVWRGV